MTSVHQAGNLDVLTKEKSSPKKQSRERQLRPLAGQRVCTGQDGPWEIGQAREKGSGTGFRELWQMRTPWYRAECPRGHGE